MGYARHWLLVAILGIGSSVNLHGCVHSVSEQGKASEVYAEGDDIVEFVVEPTDGFWKSGYLLVHRSPGGYGLIPPVSGTFVWEHFQYESFSQLVAAVRSFEGARVSSIPEEHGGLSAEEFSALRRAVLK